MSLTPTGMMLFKKDLKEYIPLDQTTFNFSDFTAYTIVAGTTYELNGKESLICLDPLQLCIIDTPELPETLTVFYTYKNTVTATLAGRKKQVVSTSSVQVYEVERSELKHYSFLRLLIYYYKINSGKKTYPFRKYFHLAAGFFYPRKVILVSVSCDDFLSIFPMDFQVCSLAENLVFLGLRKTNKTNTFTGDKNLKLSVAAFNEQHKNDVYSFGKFHTHAFPDPESLPYRFIYTQKHRNVFPDFIKSYQELELINSTELGEQNLLTFRIVNTQQVDTAISHPLYHVHYLAIHD